MPHQSRSGAVALIAEDEPLFLMVTADILTEAGFTVLEADNATKALGHLESHPEVSLLFTDIEMPGPLDGIGLAREVERRWPHVAIIVCSGRVMPEVGTLPEQARFMSKPVNMSLLLKTIREMGLQ